LAKLDILINEIASILNLTLEEVEAKFTEAELETFLEHSKCEPLDSTTPLFDSLDVPCEDLGSPLPLDSPVTDLDKISKDLKSKNKTNARSPEEVLKCVETVSELNKEIEANLDLVTQYRILLERMNELKDNIVGIDYYLTERIKRAGAVLKDFKPILIAIKNNDALIASNKKNITTKRLRISNAVVPSSEVSALNSQIQKLNEENKKIKLDNIRQREIIKGKTSKYSSFNNEDAKGALGSISSLNKASKGIISSSDLREINNELKKYSEFVKVKKYSSNRSSFSEILSSSLIQFEVDFQELNVMKFEKEVINKDTGKSQDITQTVLIKNNPLLEKNIFFTGAPGYIIKNIDRKDKPNGDLYKKYYSLLEDPINNFFSLTDRGLTDSVSLLDPLLKGSDHITKTEGEKEYYISDLKKMESFYENFDENFTARRKFIRDKIVENGTTKMKATLTRLARLDVDAILAIGRVDLYLPEENVNLKTITDSIQDSNSKFASVIGHLNSEISRISNIIKELLPTPDKIKADLKKRNIECFKDIDRPPNKRSHSTSDSSTSDLCSEADDALGSDPFFDSIGGATGGMPDFTQLCYWKEFSKIVNKMGLFPIPNGPTELRYWPVGLVLFVPAQIKIPLPIIWIPLITFSGPSGVTVLFLTINGLFISPVMFFISSSGLKQHKVMLKGSSDKFGYDRHDDTIKSIINVPLKTFAKLEKAKRPFKSIDKLLNKKEKSEIDILESKKDGASESEIEKIEKRISDIKSSATDREKSDAEKAQEIVDKKENIEDTIKETKKSIFKRMDDIGKPVLNSVNKLKEKIENRKSELRTEYIKAVEEGNTELQKELRKKMKVDGLNINEKKEAISKDLLAYFDRLDMPKLTIPKEKGKINPKLTGNDSLDISIKTSSSDKLDELASKEKSNVASNFKLAIAKYKSEIEEVIGNVTLNVNDDLDDLRKAMSNMIDKVADKSIGKLDNHSSPLKSKDVSASINKAKKSKNLNKIKELEKELSRKLDSDLVRQGLAITPALISKVANISISFDPFASCCKSSGIGFSFSPPLNPLIKQALKAGSKIVKDKIQEYSSNDFKSLFGGKLNVSSRDIRLGMLSIVMNVIPEGLSFPQPPINLTSVASMFGGLLGSMSMPQASFPSAMKALSMPKQINIDLNVVKAPLKNILKKSISSNIDTVLSQNINTDFNYISSNDLKSYLKSTINDNMQSVEDTIKPFYKLVSVAKSAKGIDLNILEKAVFSTVPYGTVIKTAFIAKGLLKMKKSNSSMQFRIDDVALKSALKLIKPVLKPIVSSPIVYPIVAAAGVANQIEGIRLIHPILNQDDIPPWERLTAKNILLLAFIDEFITNAADNIGFYRAFL
tara:strand:- start:10015 stop:14094 length:4080 start_codon:yes stop_codon:yes gene_type:complete